MWLARIARHLEKGFPEAFAAKPQAEETISGLCFLFIMQILRVTRNKDVCSSTLDIPPSRERLSMEIIRLVKDPLSQL